MSATDQEQLAAPRIDVKKAVAIAREKLQDLEQVQMYNLRLEEARRDRENGLWLITFGFDVVVESPPGSTIAPRNPLAGLLADQPRITRVYHIIALDDHTGEFDELRMRES